MVNTDVLSKILEEEEGLKLKAYPGPVTGLLHIGIGHLLEQQQDDTELQILGLEDEEDDWTDFRINPDQAYALLDYDIQQSVDRLPLLLDGNTLETIGETRRSILSLMEFQMGVAGVQKFVSFLQALRVGDYDRAADEMEWSNGLKKQRRSKWYKQTKDRCIEMAKAMREGVFATDKTHDAPSVGEASHKDTSDETASAILADLVPTIGDIQIDQRKIQADIREIKGLLEKKARGPFRS